jgi:hypothetical protein
MKTRFNLLLLSLLLLLSVTLFLPIQNHVAAASSFCFAGIEWEISSGGGPMGSELSSQNVWVDQNDMLHLLIRQDSSGNWYGSQVYTRESYGFGTYQWQVIGQLDRLDKNVVFGMFNYPGYSDDGTNEIDIEIARWGNDSWHNGNFTIYSGFDAHEKAAKTFDVSLNGDFTTHRFTWEPTKVSFRSLHGHRDNNQYTIKSWTSPSSFRSHIPQNPLPVYINRIRSVS